MRIGEQQRYQLGRIIDLVERLHSRRVRVQNFWLLDLIEKLLKLAVERGNEVNLRSKVRIP